MCQSLAEGGLRCAAHTRPRYQTAEFGTPAWDEAAAAYASTPTGRMELAASLAAAEAAQDVRSEVAFQHALNEGQRLRETAEAFRDELTTRSAPVPAPSAEDPDPDPVSMHDDYESYAPVGGYEFVDEEAWDNQSGSTWTPTMAGAQWDHTDPAFTGCNEKMTSDEFINQVCGNYGITRAEFEAAAANHFNSHGFLVASSIGGPTQVTSAGSSVSLNDLRTYALTSAPHLTPAEIKQIADEALETQVREENAAPTATNRNRRRQPISNDPAELTRLADSEDPAVRQEVAANDNTPSDVLGDLAVRDPKVEVRAAAARNENLAHAVLIPLKNDRSVKVRAGAARNPRMPVEHLRTLATDSNASVAGAVARNPTTPPDVYRTLAASSDMTVRKHAARRAHIPDDIANTLVTDSQSQVRGTLARNRTTKAEHLTALADDESQSVRAYAARNANLPPALLRGPLSRDQAPGVRAAVARNTNTSQAVLTRLSTDPDSWVRRNVAWNDNTPAALLYALNNDRDEDVRNAVRNRSTSLAS